MVLEKGLLRFGIVGILSKTVLLILHCRFFITLLSFRYMLKTGVARVTGSPYSQFFLLSFSYPLDLSGLQVWDGHVRYRELIMGSA